MKNEIMKANLYKSLAVSWALRATNKSSHAGFNACMENVRDIVPETIWDKYDLEHATLHAHRNLDKFIDDIRKELPPEIQKIIGSDMPSIEKIKEKIKEI